MAKILSNPHNELGWHYSSGETREAVKKQRSPFKPLAENEIRLLSILPSSGDDPSHCSLLHYNLTATGSGHAAISYPWGPPEDPHHQVWIDGFEKTIRDNAFNILSRLRKVEEAVSVWIDCLCIDQDNKSEKSAQIRLMYSIYKQASRTIIWPGKTDETTKEIVDYIHSIDVHGIYAEFKVGWESTWRYTSKSFILDLLQGHPNREFLINAIARLFFAVHWSRVQIRQEAAVGGNPYLLRGRYEISWKHIAVLAWLYRPRTLSG